MNDVAIVCDTNVLLAYCFQGLTHAYGHSVKHDRHKQHLHHKKSHSTKHHHGKNTKKGHTRRSHFDNSYVQSHGHRHHLAKSHESLKDVKKKHMYARKVIDLCHNPLHGFYTEIVGAEFKFEKQQFKDAYYTMIHQNEDDPQDVKHILHLKNDFLKQYSHLKTFLNKIADFSTHEGYWDFVKSIQSCMIDIGGDPRHIENDARIIADTAFWASVTPFKKVFLLSYDHHFNVTRIREALTDFFGENPPIKITMPCDAIVEELEKAHEIEMHQ